MEAAPVLDADTAARFGDHLLGGGDPFNALTQYRLALFLEPDRADAALVRYRIALAYERGDRHDAAAAAWLDLAGRHPDWSPEATYRAAMATLERDRFDEARLYLSEVQMEAPDSTWAERAAYVRAVSLLEQGDHAAARQDFAAFQAAHPGSRYLPLAAAADAALSEPPPRRSPALAAAMSAVLPGSGQVYAGHTGDGVMSFLATGTLGLSAFALLQDGLEDDVGWEIATGSVLGTLAVATWGANVLGGYTGAQRANHHLILRRGEEALREADHVELQREPEDVQPPPLER